MPYVGALRIVVLMFKRKGGIRNCICYRAMMLLEHEMTVVKMVLENDFVE